MKLILNNEDELHLEEETKKVYVIKDLEGDIVIRIGSEDSYSDCIGYLSAKEEALIINQKQLFSNGFKLNVREDK